ncbi:MAG: TonB-dependent receptor [Woeseia sp.]
MREIRGISLFVCLLLALPALASAAGDVIVVTATRSELALQDVIVPVTIINREQIELAAASDVAELLRFEAGLDIGRNGGPGQASSIFMRGTESNHTLVLVDGVRINPGTIGGAALQNIAPEVIERIEIVKGARSSLYGTDAIGGVINIITRRAGDGYAEAGAGAGSFATQSAYASFGANGSAGEFGLTLNAQDTDGYAIRSDSDVERGYDNVSANIYGSRQLGNSTVNIRHWRASGRSEYLDFFLAPIDQDYRNESSALEIATPLGERSASRLLISHMLDEIEQNQSPDFVLSRRNALDWQYSLNLTGHNFAAGIYVTEEKARAESFGSGFSENTATRAVFLQDSITHGRHRAFIAGRYTDHDTFGNELTWNAEYALDVTEAWSLSAGIGHAFRAPDASDRFGFGGNAELKPEVADEIQLGAKLELNARNTVHLELYRNDIDDLIEFDLGTFTLQNLASAEIRGAQLGWAYQGDKYRLRTDVVAQRAENAADGSKLLRRADRSLTVNLTRALGSHTLGLSMLASGRREDFAESLPGYVLVNLTGQFRLGQQWQLNSRIENLLDTEYQTAAPYRMAERSAFLELKYRWR